jgi:putative colanic acid biosynthesis UDP-glucose lipid carrier transferase
MRSTINEIYKIILGCIIVYAFLLLIGFALKISHEYSRRLFLTWAIIWPGFMGIERLFIRRALRHFREKGYNTRSAIVAGAGRQGERLVEEIDGHPWAGVRVVGFFDDKVYRPLKDRPILGTLKELPAYVHKNSVDLVFLALTMKEEARIHWLLKELADTTVSVYHVPDIFFFDFFLGGSLICFNMVPIIPLRESPLYGMNALLKRMLDLIFASIILILVCPIMLAISIGIKLTSPGSILFKQWRYGIDGRAIKVYKFRTMTVCEDGYSFTQATECDSRVTRLGAFLRRTSLDELPQFFNVLQGRMSIVGPRPHAVAMNEEYRKLVPGYMLRHKVKPGITGLAQVNGWRGETESLEKMEKRVEFDLEYLRQWSLMLDLRIIAQTIFNGSWRTNAH